MLRNATLIRCQLLTAPYLGRASSLSGRTNTAPLGAGVVKLLNSRLG